MTTAHPVEKPTSKDLTEHSHGSLISAKRVAGTDVYDLQDEKIGDLGALGWLRQSDRDHRRAARGPAEGSIEWARATRSPPRPLRIRWPIR